MTHVFTVEDTFEVAGRLVALIPGIPVARIREFERERSAELRRPDGSILRVEFTIPHVSPTDPNRPFCIGIPAPIKKSDIPIGTQVWMTSNKEPNQPLTAQRLDGVRFEFGVASSAWLTRDRWPKDFHDERRED